MTTSNKTESQGYSPVFTTWFDSEPEREQTECWQSCSPAVKQATEQEDTNKCTNDTNQVAEERRD